MEESRLRPMAENYNPVLFNTLYGKTEGLRRKLASQVDCRRFGVDYEEVLSWFTVKFIFVFNKHHEEPEEKILAFIINSLQNFKNRVLRKAYTHKFSQNIIPFEAGVTVSEDELEAENPLEDNTSQFYSQLMTYLSKVISDNALMLLETTLNPPPYILRRLREIEHDNIQKIPEEILMEYFNLGPGKGHRYLLALKKEIKQGISSAKYHFKASE